MARRKRTIEEYFWARVQKTDSCWLWTGTIDNGGYGAAYYQSPDGPKHHQAHRVSWKVHFGDIPDGLHVCHHCDVRNCVRPDHLFLGTDLANAIDREQKGRGRREGITNRNTKGEGNGFAKLTDHIVRQIRTDPAVGTREHRRGWAGSLGVSENCIRDIVSYRRWRHV